ncbi:MAG: thiamine pyrophosphate-binding protein, partial [Candidatus Acidiferrales bacterium]
MTVRLTAAQATIAYLKNQYSERDGQQFRFFAGCLGIFGHGNVAGLGQALEQDPGLRYYLFRNEQAMVHAATAFAKTSFRMRALVCTSSIGPGATNMITGAATATINRLPVLLLPGDIFARRSVAPVLQQLESPSTQDISVNDCFKPVSRYWDRIERPEQLLTSLPEAIRVLTSPAETGAVTIAFPQDVQAEAFDYPEKFFAKKVWLVPRNRCDHDLLRRAAEWIRAAKNPLIVAGGGVLYSQASEALAQFTEATGIPVCETQAGKGSLPYDHPQQLGAVGVTGTPGANIAAREADLILGIGTRYSDFTSASKTAFQNPAVRFINVNVAEFDSYKHAGLPLTGDARLTIAELQKALSDFSIEESYRTKINEFRARWEDEVDRNYGIHQPPPITQGEVIGIVNNFTKPSDIVVCAAGSLPGDLHKLWRTRQPGGYHMEYGFSCMGYEIA